MQNGLCSAIGAKVTPLGLLLLSMAATAVGQEIPLAWDQVKNFRYNIELIKLDQTVTPRVVTVVFSVTNPDALNAPYDIKSVAPGTPFRGSGRLSIDVAWSTAQYTNTGSTPPPPLAGGGEGLLNIARTWMIATPPSPGGVGPATPNQVNALSAAQPCQTGTSLDLHCAGVANATLRFWVTSTLPSYASGTGTVGIEGHPVVQTGFDPSGNPIVANVPVTSAVKDFPISGVSVTARPAIVTMAKCKQCHDGLAHRGQVIPRLSLHGSNRNEEPALCVVCHNADQTDIAYRTSGSEESIDFKRMIHGIHAGPFRRQPLVIIGFRGSVNDYRNVRFPRELSNCTLCHIEAGNKGSFELPLRAGNLGSTINTGSLMTAPGLVDVNPVNNLRISPIAATCSACHGKSEARNHMIKRGASFGATQDALAGKEQCVTCHGPGKSKDVRKVHEIDEEDREHGDEKDDDR